MRYRIEETSNTLVPVSNGDSALMLAVILGIAIGVVCIYLGWKGKQLWLKFWGIGLTLVSCIYIAYVTS